MLFLDAVAYILSKEGNKARMKNPENYKDSFVIFSGENGASKGSGVLFTYLRINDSKLPLPLNINSEIINTSWEAI